MTILYITPPWLEEQTKVVVMGEHEDAVTSVIAGAFLAGKYDVTIEDEDGDQVPYLEFNHG